MKNSDLGRTIQIIANIGVVAGLAFLALELRQNSDLLVSQSRFNYTQIQMEMATLLVANGELANVVARALDGSEVSPGEALRLRQLFLVMLNSWEFQYREFEDGRVTREELKVGSKRQDYDVLSRLAPGVWAGFRTGSYAPFVDFVETEVIRPTQNTATQDTNP